VNSDRIAELYRTWGPAIYRRCLRLLRDPEAARDATQEVFRKALSSPGKLADPATGLPFIYRVATNHCLNERRNAGRRGETELVDLDLAAILPDFPQRRLVQRVLSRFDSRTQSIAVGVLWTEWSMKKWPTYWASPGRPCRASWRASSSTRANTWNGAPHEPSF